MNIGQGIAAAHTNLKLTPEKAATVAAIQRLVAAMQLEAQQLGGIWKETAAALQVLEAMKALDAFGHAYVQHSQQRIILPAAPPVPQATP